MPSQNPLSSVSLIVLSCLLNVACFGDNDDSAIPSADTLTISEFIAPEEIDGGDSVDISIRVKGRAGEQLSIAMDGPSGVFLPQSKVIIADDAGEARFETRFTTSNVAATTEVTANVSNLQLLTASASKALKIYEVERVGNIAPLPTATETANYLVAYPMSITPPRTLSKLAIVAPAAATAAVGLYSNGKISGLDAPTTPLVKRLVSLTVGANELVIPALSLTAEKYWIVITYEGTPVVGKMPPVEIDAWALTTFGFPAELPDVLPTLNRGLLSKRNFYLVVRK